MRVESRKEHKFQDVLVDKLRERGSHVTSFVGSMYIAGQPDIEVVNKNGAIIKIELKVYRDTILPTSERVINLLRGPQVNTITRQLWGRNAPCLLVAEIAYNPGVLAIVYKTQMTLSHTDDFIRVICCAPLGTCPYLINQTI